MQNSVSSKRLIVFVIVPMAVLLLAIGFTIYSNICPCDGTPGGFLLGEKERRPVDDWAFVNEVPLCQIQIWAGIRPHSINLNCMSTPDGELYVSCGNCDTKYWQTQVGANEKGLIRINGNLYPVIFNRVTDPTEMDRVYQASTNKRLARGEGSPPDRETWGTFNLKFAI